MWIGPMHHSEIACGWLVICYTFAALCYGAVIKKLQIYSRYTLNLCALKRENFQE